MRIIGLMVVGPGEKYLEKSLDELKRLCDDAMICGNNTDPETESIIHSYGFKFYRDDRVWGKHQPDIKTDLLRKIGTLRPDWIVAIDSDEVFDKNLTRGQLEALARKGGIGYYFYVVNLWNDRDHYNKGWSFWNIRFYKYAPEFGLQFQKKSLHCGLGPPIVYQYGNYAPFILKHYGLMDKEDRMRKVRRYQEFDPNAVYKDRSYYDMLARDYPGDDFSEDELHRKVEDEVRNYKHKEVKTMETKKYVYVRRLEDGRVLDMEDKAWKEIQRDSQRNKQFEFVSEIMIGGQDELPPVVEDEVVIPSQEFACSACGKVMASETSLKIHTGRMHK